MTDNSTNDRLVVRRLTDRAQLAALLGREPVNPVDDVHDADAMAAALADRTDVDRRVFGLVDADDPTRTRTVVWVALTVGVPTSLVELTDDRPPTDPARADTAVFWSIWNDDLATPGAGTGVDLIVGAVELLSDELPHLSTFVTLSPAPGFREWLDRSGVDGSGVDGTALGPSGLASAGARYLTSLDDEGRPLDRVARFHLRNGARVWRVLPGADPSARGRTRSYGLMVNYRYAPEDREANRAALRRGEVAVGDQVRAHLDR